MSQERFLDRIPRNVRTVAINCGGELSAFTSGMLFISGHQVESAVFGLLAVEIGIANILRRYKMMEKNFIEPPVSESAGAFRRLLTDALRPEGFVIREILAEVFSKSFAFTAGHDLLSTRPEFAIVFGLPPLFWSTLNIWRMSKDRN